MAEQLKLGAYDLGYHTDSYRLANWLASQEPVTRSSVKTESDAMKQHGAALTLIA